MFFPNNYKYLRNVTKAIAHARGVTFVSVPESVLELLFNCPARDDESVAAYVKAYRTDYTDEFGRFAVEINRILRDDVIKGHMCASVFKTSTDKKNKTKVERILPMGQDYLMSSLGQNKKEEGFAGTSLMLALQMTDLEILDLNAAALFAPSRKRFRPTVHCVAVLAYKGVHNNDPVSAYTHKDGNVETFSSHKEFVETPNRAGEPKASQLQQEIDAGQMLDISLLCGGVTDHEKRARQETIRLLTIYTIAKEMMRRSEGVQMYRSVFMDCASYPVFGKKERNFDAENIAIQLGFHRWDVHYSDFPKDTLNSKKTYAATGKNKDFVNFNNMYNYSTGTNRVYVLTNAGDSISLKLLYYLDNRIANTEMLKKLCPMVSHTTLSKCV